MPDEIRHDHTLSRPVQVFTLCPKCAKEVEVHGHKNLAGVYLSLHSCPRCSARIDVWVRIVIGPEPEAPVAAINASPDASPETVNALGAMIQHAAKIDWNQVAENEKAQGTRHPGPTDGTY